MFNSTYCPIFLCLFELLCLVNGLEDQILYFKRSIDMSDPGNHLFLKCFSLFFYSIIFSVFFLNSCQTFISTHSQTRTRLKRTARNQPNLCFITVLICVVKRPICTKKMFVITECSLTTEFVTTEFHCIFNCYFQPLIVTTNN